MMYKEKNRNEIMKGQKMRKQKLIFILLLIFYLCISIRSSEIEFVSIECPEKIIITEDINMKNFELKLEIKYKYVGKDIVFKEYPRECNLLFSYIKLFPSGSLYYINTIGGILPGALKYVKECGLNLCIGGSSFVLKYPSDNVTVLKKNKVYSWPISVISYAMSKDTEIFEAIRRKELATIVIIIQKIELEWRLKDCNHNELGKGKIVLDDVNRVKIIEIRYNGKK